MRLRRRHLPFIVLLGAAVAMLPSLASSATTANVSAESSLYLNKWSPGEVAVTPSGTVTFHNATGVNHGIVWDSVPATPACENTVPVGSFSTSWNGNCTFAQSGVYTYYCSYHGRGMSGSVYVNAGGTLPPSAHTEAAGAVSETGATLRGSVNPEGQPTTYHFEYGASTSYDHETEEASAGEGSTPHEVSASIGGLSPGTVYHFRLVAKYASGATTLLGGDRTFQTASPPGPPPPTTTTTTTTSTTSPPPLTATTTTSVTTTPAPSVSGASSGAAAGSPLAGSASTAIKVASTQRGSSVRGSLAISPAGAGARLEVDLLASTASLARRHAKQVRIGRLLRSSLAAGKVSFSVSLNAKAKRALRRHKRLPVIVQITLTPPHGAAITVTRSIVLRG